MQYPMGGAQLSPKSPKRKDRVEIRLDLERKVDLAVRRRCLALGIPRTVYLRNLIQADLDSATEHDTN